MAQFLTREQANAIVRAISNGYHDRDDYPPFALTSIEDRSRFQAYIGRVIDDLAKE